MFKNCQWLCLVLLLGFQNALFAQKKDFENKAVLKPYVKNGVELFNLQSLNTPALDFSPVYYQKGLVYVSSRIKSGPRDPNINETFFELFYSEFTPNREFSKPISFSLQLNSRLHEGPVSFNRDGNMVYLTRNNLKDGVTATDQEGRVGLKIYEAAKGAYDWQNLQELPFNNDNFSCMHPALSPDGNRIFFASNKPGGYGGYDLYMAEKRGGSWSDMYNLGPEINTPGNDVFPFLHESGVFFFSSDGHKGMGNLDIYYIDIRSRIWGPLTNIGEPFNSKFDDFGFVVDPAGRSGFFTSDRPGGVGKDDLYGFQSPQGINGLFQPVQKSLAIQVLDQERNQPIPGAAIYVFERGNDGLIADNSLYDIQIIPGTGALGREASLHFVRKPSESLGNPTTITQPDGTASLQVAQGKDYILVIHAPNYQTTDLLLFAKKPGAVKPLEVKLQRQNCRVVKVAVRAKPTQKGLPGVKLRLVGKNTGAEETLFTTIEGKTEFCVMPETDYTLFLEKEGFTSLQMPLEAGQLEKTSILDLQVEPVTSTASITMIKENTIIVLPTANSDSESSGTGATETRNLYGILRFMEVFPRLYIELGVHTDSRGEAAFNLQLSARRAETAKEFLVSRGILASRIHAVGYGETRLKNGCEDGVPCSEAEHLQNRRTEIRVIQPGESSGN